MKTWKQRLRRILSFTFLSVWVALRLWRLVKDSDGNP